MSEPDLRAFLECAAGAAAKVFAERGKLSAMYHIITRKGEHGHFFAPPFPKDFALAIVKVIFEEEDVVRYCFMDEAWTYHTKDPSDVRPARTHPDRVEVIVFQAEDESEGELIGRQQIIRAPGQPPRLGPLEIERPAISSGRMVGLLPRRAKNLQ